jgi:transketolase
MRNKFAELLTSKARENKKIVLLVGDIGNKLFDKYKKNFPNRFYNCGVAESAMTSIAAGLAKTGLKPFTYTIATFNTLRCLEQIKLDLGYQNLDVTIVGTGSGLSYASLGATHHSLDDFSILKCIPNLKILSPADSVELESSIELILKNKGPYYLRIGKKNEEKVFKNIPKSKLGKVNIVYKGSKNLIICVGPTLSLGNEIYENLKKPRETELVSVHSIKPFDKIYFKKSFKNKKKIILLEEQMKDYGFANTLKNYLYSEKIFHKNFYNYGTPDIFLKGIGSQGQARDKLLKKSSKIIEEVKI